MTFSLCQGTKTERNHSRHLIGRWRRVSVFASVSKMEP